MKILIIISLLSNFLFCQIISLQAQCKGWSWVAGAGGKTFDDAESILVDNADKSIYISGYFDSDTIFFGNDTLYNGGSSDAFITKYDSTGNILWARSISGNDIDCAFNLSIDISDNVYCSGNFRSDSIVLESGTLINKGGQNFFIIKYDSDGNVLWSKSEGGNGIDYIEDITVDNSDNLFAVGGFESPEIIFGLDTLSNSGIGDLFIAKYGADGEVVWAKKVGGKLADFGNNVTTDNLGYIFITGTFSSDTIDIGSQVLINKGYQDFFVLKMDTDGNIIWVKDYGGNSFESILDIAMDDFDNIYMTGYFRSDTLNFGPKILLNNGGSDIFYAKLDSSGNALWANSSGGESFDWSYSIAINSTGEVYLSGNFESPCLWFDSLYIIRNSYPSGFLAKLDNDGNALWTKIIGDTDYDNYVRDLTLDNSGDIYLTGLYSGEYISFGLDTLRNTDNIDVCYDIYVLKLSDCISPPTPTISLNGDSLISDSAFKYQWYYENTYIPNAKYRMYVVHKTGYYYVEVTNTNGCNAFSEKLYVLITDINDDNILQNDIYLFPNPFSKSTILIIPQKYEKPYWLDIIAISGKVVGNYSNTNSNEILIQKDNMPEGFYFYRLKNRNGVIKMGKLIIK